MYPEEKVIDPITGYYYQIKEPLSAQGNCLENPVQEDSEQTRQEN